MTPSSFAELRPLAEAAVIEQDYQKAADLIIQIIRADHGDEAWKYCSEKIKGYSEVRSAFTGIMKEQELGDDGIDRLIKLGDLLMADKQPDAAEPFYVLALEKDPGKVRASGPLLDIYITYFRDAEKAAAVITKYVVMQSPPDPADLARKYKEIGKLYLNEEDDAVKAAEFYLKAVTLQPDHCMYQYSLGLALRYQERYTEAFDIMKKALELAKNKKDKGEVLFMLGEISGLLYNPHHARAYYEDALKCDDKMLYAYHNLVVTCYALSDYRQGNIYLQKALGLYEEELKNDAFKDDPGKYYYYAELIRDYKGPKETADYELWEKMLTRYNESQYAAVDGMAEMFKMQLARRKAIEDGEYLARHPERDHYFEQYHGRVIFWYNKTIEKFKSLFKETTDKVKLKDFHAQLGKLYLSFDMYDEAKASFQEVLKLAPADVDGLDGLGVAYFKKKEYKQAIQYFNDALRLNPASLNIECNLADSYRSNGDVEEAELIYLKVLNKCPKYLDALVGLGECNKLAGDKAVEDDNPADADEYFLKARSYYQKALDQRNDVNPSKRLTKREENALYYSLGYTKVRLYEVSKGLNAGLLAGARRDLKRVSEQAPEYVKSQKAIRQIKKRTILYAGAKKNAPLVIFILALLLFAGAQYVALNNYFSKGKKVYVLNKDAFLVEGAKTSDADSTLLVRTVSPLLLKEFSSLDQVKEKLAASVDPKFMPLVDTKMVTEKLVKPTTLDSVSYAFFTFSSLLFMVVGLFLPYITRLKVGSIEMDKAEVDTVKVTAPIIKK